MSLAFTLVGVWMISKGEMIGWPVSIFFGICCMVFIVVLLPNSFYLRISKNGFEVCSLFRSEFTAWDEVGRFESGYIGPSKMVVFNYSPGHRKYKAAKSVAKTMTGFEGALPDTYGKSAEALAKLLNEWRERFRR